MIRPDQFDHHFFCYVKIFGLEIKVLCAYDDPEDVFVWVADSMHHISYDLPLNEWSHIKTLAHQHLESV